MMKTLILGLGNTILSDDGVGIKVARELKTQLQDPAVEVKEAAVGGLELLDLITGYNKVIVIDSIKTKEGKVGELYFLKAEDLKKTAHLDSPHSINFATALELGQRLNFKMPKDIHIYAVEVEKNDTFSEECTPKIANSISKIAKTIMKQEF